MVPVDDDGRPLGWPMEPLARAALPHVKHPWHRTPEMLAYAFAEPDEFAVEAAMRRGWCTDTEADRWAVVGLLLMPWHVWGDEWFTVGAHPLDRLHALEEWWRPAWEWAHAQREAQVEARRRPLSRRRRRLRQLARTRAVATAVAA